MSLQPRPYQTKAIQDIRAALASGAKRAVLVSPTASGKSAISAMIGAGLHKNGKRAVYLGHRTEIVFQLGAALRTAGVPFSFLTAATIGMPRANIVVASIATLHRRKERLPIKPDLLFIDEAHHARSRTWEEVIRHFPDAKVVGLTATPCRLDGKGLGEIFDAMVLGPHTDELIAQGFLSDFEVYAPKAPNLSQVHTRGGDYVSAELEAAMRKQVITGDAIKHYRRLADGKSAVVFCVSVAHAEEVAQQFRAAGYKFQSIDGKMSAEQRAALIKDMTDGRLQGLTSCDIISEGTDIPRIEVAILLRPTKSMGLYKQQCLDIQTEVLTKRGWMYRSDIRNDDLVASWNMETDNCEWLPINRITDRLLGNEPIVQYAAPHLNFRVTAGHHMVVRSRSATTKTWIKQTAAVMSARQEMFFVPVSAVENICDYPISDDEIKFIGWFLTDGCMGKANKVVVINQSLSKPKHVEEIRTVLDACGFKYGIYDAKKRLGDKHYSDVRAFSVSHGRPRGAKKHLRGWGNAAAAPFLDKNIPPIFDKLSARQFSILINAMFLGDGANTQNTITWISRTMTITTGDNEKMADRIQALSVTRGFRCNKNTSRFKIPNRKDQYFLHLRAQRKRTIAGTKSSISTMGDKSVGRSFIEVLKADPVEPVWCVSNDNGTIFIRRQGKVMIVGNCGRGLRLFAGKQKLIILDHAGNTLVHGLPDERVEWSLAGGAKREASGERAVALRNCPKCLAVHKFAPACPRCGHVYVVKSRKIETVDGDLELMVRGSHAATGKSKGYWDAALEALETIEKAKGYKKGWAKIVLAARQETERKRMALALETGVRVG